MKKGIVAYLFSMGVVVGLMSGLAWAGSTAAELSKQCQEALQKTPNKEASALCQEGDALLKAGKEKEAAAKLTSGLEKLGVMKVGKEKKP